MIGMAARRAVQGLIAAIVMGACLAIGVAIASPVLADVKVPKGEFALGDSVMLGARTALRARGFSVDAEQSRQAYTGPAELRRLGGSLPENVVVHLGTNGTFPLSTCKAMVKAVGVERNIFLVTVHVPRSWTKGNNQVIRQCAAAYPDGRVTVVDWNWAASRHPGWLYADHTHLTASGARGYARVIADAVARKTATVPVVPSPSASTPSA